MKDAPSRQAVTKSMRVHTQKVPMPVGSVHKSLTDTASNAHDPATSIIADYELHRDSATVVVYHDNSSWSSLC